MNSDLLQAILDIVFRANMIYLAPILFLLMTVLFTDRVVDIIFNSVIERRRYR